MPRMRSSNTLGNVGSLLQDVVDTTEDLALRTDVGKSEISGLSPKMRMAIMKNRIMKSAMVVAEDSSSGGEKGPRSARIDSGLVATESSKEGQVGTFVVHSRNR